MKKHFLLSFLLILVLNVFLFVMKDFNKFLIYILINIFGLVCYFIILKLIKLENELSKVLLKSKDDGLNLESAENHPIIKSARERLGK